MFNKKAMKLVEILKRDFHYGMVYEPAERLEYTGIMTYCDVVHLFIDEPEAVKLVEFVLGEETEPELYEFGLGDWFTSIGEFEHDDTFYIIYRPMGENNCQLRVRDRETKVVKVLNFKADNESEFWHKIRLFSVGHDILDIKQIK